MPELHLLTGAYALDALDDVERADFERHLRTCDSCPGEVIELREAAGALADRVAAPAPERLRERVLAEVGRTRQVSPHERRPRRRPSLRRLLSIAASAVVIAGSAGLGGIAWQGHRSADQYEDQALQSAQRAARMTGVMTDPGRIEAVGTPSLGGTATVVAAGGDAVLATRALPAPPAGRMYQLWVVRGEVKRPAGRLDLHAGTGQALLTGVANGDTVAVTIEPEGGSDQPTTGPVVAIRVA